MGYPSPLPSAEAGPCRACRLKKQRKHVALGRRAALRAASGRSMGLFSFWTSEAALSGPGLRVLF